MYDIKEMLNNTNLMLDRSIDLITDSMSDIITIRGVGWQNFMTLTNNC